MSADNEPVALEPAPAAAARPDDIAGILAQADLLAEHEQWAEARALYEEILRLDPHNPAAHNGVGIACEELDESAEAERHYRAAIAARPDYFVAYTNLGALYEEQKRTLRAMRRMLTACPMLLIPRRARQSRRSSRRGWSSEKPLWGITTGRLCSPSGPRWAASCRWPPIGRWTQSGAW
ncbi:MAG: tetratricopeptide repeat protein [Chloroflexi bacterium]|nr:tetratricopeptide repeat protein [Chloroflexota bacterium]